MFLTKAVCKLVTPMKLSSCEADLWMKLLLGVWPRDDASYLSYTCVILFDLEFFLPSCNFSPRR